MVPKDRNAYMLIYERVFKDTSPELQSVLNSVDDLPALDSSSDSSSDNAANFPSVFYASMFASKVRSKAKSRRRGSTLKVDVPAPIFGEVWKDNMKFFRYKKIFGKDYFSFINGLLSLEEHPPVKGNKGMKSSLRLFLCGFRSCVAKHPIGHFLLPQSCVTFERSHDVEQDEQTIEEEVFITSSSLQVVLANAYRHKHCSQQSSHSTVSPMPC